MMLMFSPSLTSPTSPGANDNCTAYRIWKVAYVTVKTQAGADLFIVTRPFAVIVNISHPILHPETDVELEKAVWT
jgi:hypothetical protein